MKKAISYSAAGIVTGGIAYILYKNLFEKEEPKQEDPEELYKKSQKETTALVISEFIDLIIKKPTITLDEAILKFENTDETDLEVYAQKKMRNRESYIKSYTGYYSEAKNILQLF